MEKIDEILVAIDKRGFVTSTKSDTPEERNAINKARSLGLIYGDHKHTYRLTKEGQLLVFSGKTTNEWLEDQLKPIVPASNIHIGHNISDSNIKNSSIDNIKGDQTKLIHQPNKDFQFFNFVMNNVWNFVFGILLAATIYYLGFN